MELKQVWYFVAIADAGSISGGAARAFVAQPTLSAAMSKLESELGTRLFERRARGTALTAEGENVLRHARVILREAEALKATGKSKVVKPLKLGLLPTLPPAFVADVLSRLRAFEADRVWHSEDANETLLRQRLAAGRYDAIVTRLERAERRARQIELTQDVQAVAVAERDAPSRKVDPTYLHGRVLIVRTHCEMLQAASRILDDWHVQPHVVARTNDDSRALAMMASGVGACLLPDSFHHAGVVFVRPWGPVLTRRLGIEWIKGAAGGLFDRLAAKLK